MAKPRVVVSVPYNLVEMADLEERARRAKMPLATYIRSLSMREQLHLADRIIPDSAVKRGAPRPNRYGCPATCAPCEDELHSLAEARIVSELVPRYRAMIEPRDPAEGPHEYIARYWADHRLKPLFNRDLAVSLGFEKDDAN